jgi:hypothetical protein
VSAPGPTCGWVNKGMAADSVTIAPIQVRDWLVRGNDFPVRSSPIVAPAVVVSLPYQYDQIPSDASPSGPDARAPIPGLAGGTGAFPAIAFFAAEHGLLRDSARL